MPEKRLGVEQVVTKLRQVEVLQSQGKSVAAVCKEADLTELSPHREHARSASSAPAQFAMVLQFCPIIEFARLAGHWVGLNTRASADPSAAKHRANRGSVT